MEHYHGTCELRELGSHWEREFAKIIGWRGAFYTLHQEDRDRSATFHFFEKGELKSKPLPDLTIFNSPSWHAEVKHKTPTNCGWIGLEQHRVRAMLQLADVSDQHVLYVVHRSDTDEWIACSIEKFVDYSVREMLSPSLVSGEVREVPTLYTPLVAFTELDLILSELLPLKGAA